MDLNSKLLRSKGETYDNIETIFVVIGKWNNQKLPTYKEVIGLVRKNVDTGSKYDKAYDKAIAKVAVQLHKHWIKCKIYPVTYVATKARLAKVINEYRTISRTHNSKKGKMWQDRYLALKDKANKLFDIFNEDPAKRKQQEKEHGIPMMSEDYQYLEHMRRDRKGSCETNTDIKWHQLEEKRMMKRDRYLARQTGESATVSSSVLSDDSSTDDVFHVEDNDYSLAQSDSLNEKTSNARKQAKYCDFNVASPTLLTRARSKTSTSSIEESSEASDLPLKYQHIRKSERIVRDEVCIDYI